MVLKIAWAQSHESSPSSLETLGLFEQSCKAFRDVVVSSLRGAKRLEVDMNSDNSPDVYLCRLWVMCEPKDATFS
jgi:hypothetical protein